MRLQGLLLRAMCSPEGCRQCSNTTKNADTNSLIFGISSGRATELRMQGTT